MSRKFEFVWLDVFTRTPLEGNQLAVFPDAHGLTDEEMQSIARETHLSETTFVFPENDRLDREFGFKTRIFAVSGEMPFAGHPTLGTAGMLAGMKGLNEVSLLLKVGKIPVTFSMREGHRFGEMVQKDPTIGQTHEPKAVAKALNVSQDDLDDRSPIQTVSTGVPYAIVPFRSLSAITRIRPSWTAMERYLSDTDASFFYMVSRETVNASASIHARMIFSGGEDPATGSAAGPAAAWALLNRWTKPGRSEIIEQGLEVHRPSQIHVNANLRDGKPVNIRVGGHFVQMMRGQLDL